MFPYDSAIAAAVRSPARSIADVLRTLRTIDASCADIDGLKWFNWLYLKVTEAVEARVSHGGFSNLSWLADLDVRFAQLYFDALQSSLAGGRCPGCWSVVFAARGNVRVARLQFALAGMNAHINRDLPDAIVATCQATRTVPAHGTSLYADYTAVNSTLESLIEIARTTLNVRLPGDPLPAASNLEETVAAWKVSAARETAWDNAEALWNLPPLLTDNLKHSIDGFTTVVGKTLLVPVP
jgi:Family of unknown function (DUF5995)